MPGKLLPMYKCHCVSSLELSLKNPSAHCIYAISKPPGDSNIPERGTVAMFFSTLWETGKDYAIHYLKLPRTLPDAVPSPGAEVQA